MRQLFTHLLHASLLSLSVSFGALAQEKQRLAAPISPSTGPLLYDHWDRTVTTNDRRKAGRIDGKSIGNGGESNFATLGGQWNHCPITYFFANGTPDITSDGGRQAVRSAFNLWSNQADLLFTEVSTAAQADIVVLWAARSHGDGADFDGQNGVLAHAFTPPPVNNGPLAGDVHFDEDEVWTTTTQSSANQPIDLVTVAAHEIGHALGLDHSTAAGALMQAYYNGSQRYLGLDDIAGIQSIYGTRTHTISGPGQLCASTTTYSVPNLTTSASVSWSSSDSGIASINSTTGVATAVGSGLVTISATITTLCAVSTITKEVNVNASPQYPVITQYDFSNDCYRVANFRIDNFDPSITYTVNRIANAAPLPLHPTTSVFRTKGGGGGSGPTYGSFTVTATTACGTTTTDVIDVEYPCGEITPVYRPVAATIAYPNPVAETLTLPEGAEQGLLLNSQGEAVKVADKAGKLDVQNLPDGLYNLQLWQAGKRFNQRIQVKH